MIVGAVLSSKAHQTFSVSAKILIGVQTSFFEWGLYVPLHIVHLDSLGIQNTHIHVLFGVQGRA